jgi:hypothetical protein
MPVPGLAAYQPDNCKGFPAETLASMFSQIDREMTMD